MELSDSKLTNPSPHGAPRVRKWNFQRQNHSEKKSESAEMERSATKLTNPIPRVALSVRKWNFQRLK